jgi:hypothetical protein
MGRFLMVIVLVVAGIVGLGFYRGWFHFDSDSADGQTHLKLTVDQKKVQEDEAKAVKKVKGID